VRVPVPIFVDLDGFNAATASDLADWATVIGSLVAIGAVLYGWWIGRSRSINRILYRVKKSCIEDVMVPAIGSRPRVRAWLKASTRHVSTGHDAQAELDGLMSFTKETEKFLVSSRSDGLLSDDQCTSLADAYCRYADRLESRLLFATTSNPLIESEAGVARQFAELLRGYADGELIGASENLRGTGWFSWTRKSGRARFISFEHNPDEIGGAAHDIAVTYRTRRPATVEKIDESTTDLGPRGYNGELPWLVARRFERDQTNGRPRLHLSLERASFRQFLAVNKARESELPERDESFPEDGLVVMSAIPVDQDDRLIFIRRNRALRKSGNALVSFATGNLDLKTRRRIDSDFGPMGMPDPAMAIVRELREETGLIVDAEKVYAAGLCQTWTPKDRGTWILCFAATLDLTAGDLARQIRHADPVEGAWEVGGELFALTLPPTVNGVAHVLRSLADQDDVVDHLIGNIVAIASVRGIEMGNVFAEMEAIPEADPDAWLRCVETFDISHPFGRRVQEHRSEESGVDDAT